MLAIFHAISVFAAELCSTLSGNSLEEPLGELPDPLFSKLKHAKVSASTEKHTARTHKHTHALRHAGLVEETKKRETREGNKCDVMFLNRGGHCYQTKLVMRFIVLALSLFIIQPSPRTSAC